MKLSLDNIQSFLEREGDWTIRLLNKSIQPPKQYIFALLWFNGSTSLWTVRFLEQNLRPAFEESKKEFTGAKQILIEKARVYLSKGYKITVLASGYDIPPWLQRKR